MTKEQCKECTDRSLCDSDRFDTENTCPYFRKKTWFDVLSQSKRKLAENLVFEEWVDDKWGTYYKSTIFENYPADGTDWGYGGWQTKEEAIEATIKKLDSEYHETGA